MKTAQIMIRDLKGVPVRQNHKTKMFNANDLLDAYKKSKPQSKKALASFIKTKATTEYIEYLSKKAKESEQSKYGEIALFEISDKKKDTEEVIKTSRGRVNGGTWMHPNLFIDFAMWLSVEFKDWVITCMSDNLLQYRDDAGESFKEVNLTLSACGNPRQYDFIQEAKMINGIVFGKETGGQRNKATEEQLDLLRKIQKADIKMIKKGLNKEQRRKQLTVLKKLLTDEEL
jgi:hypothetical protein